MDCYLIDAEARTNLSMGISNLPGADDIRILDNGRSRLFRTVHHTVCSFTCRTCTCNNLNSLPLIAMPIKSV